MFQQFEIVQLIVKPLNALSIEMWEQCWKIFQFHNGKVPLYFTHLKRRVHKQSIESLVFTYIILAIQLLVF